MANWLERARREIPKRPDRPTAVTDERTLTAVMAVSHSGVSGISSTSNGSNGSIPSAPFPSNCNFELPDTPPDPDKSEPFNQAAMDRIKAGEPVRVWSGVLGEWLYWLRGEPERKALIDRGVELGRIYTLGELAVIINQRWTPQDVRNLHTMKREFGATIEPTRLKYEHCERD